MYVCAYFYNSMNDLHITISIQVVCNSIVIILTIQYNQLFMTA